MKRYFFKWRSHFDLMVWLEYNFYFSSWKIEAKDTGLAEAVVADVQVTLVDENDNTPTFTSDVYKGYVLMNHSVGMLLVQVSCFCEINCTWANLGWKCKTFLVSCILKSLDVNHLYILLTAVFLLTFLLLHFHGYETENNLYPTSMSATISRV